MLITMTNELTPRQAENVRSLHALCAAHDGTYMALSLDGGMNFDPGLPAYYLGMEGGKAVAFLTVFAPDPTEAEIIAFTAPQYRRRGFFRALLAEAKVQLDAQGVERLLMLCDAGSADGRAALAALGARCEFSEYSMVRSLENIPGADTALHITEAGPAELDDLAALAAEIHSADPAYYRAMLGKAIASDSMTVYSAWLDGQRAGLCRVIWDEQPPNICTLGIRPDLRGHGLGEALLYLVLHDIAARGHAAAGLEVNSENTAALSLYRKAGFTVKAQVDYHCL